MVLGFQDDDFVVEYAAGDVLLDLIGFTYNDPTRPLKLLLRFERSGWSSCFLDAFIAFWHTVDEPTLSEILEEYADDVRVDYTDLWAIRGARVVDIVCSRIAGRTSVVATLDKGTFVFREVDGSDHASESEMLWSPAGAA